MGFTDKIHFIYLLESGDTAVDITNNEPVQQASIGPWPSAFSDTVRARYASEGLAQIFSRTQMDPSGVNYVDFMRKSFPATNFASDGHVFYSTAANTMQSGDRSLHIKAKASTAATELFSPLFRVSEGKPYRISMRWKASVATAALFSCEIKTYTENWVLSAGSSTGLMAGTNGSWQWDSFVYTAVAGDRFGYIYLSKPAPSTAGDIYVDEILVEPIGEYFYGTNTAATSINDNTPTIIPFTSVTDYGSCWSTNTYTVKRPGCYQISAAIGWDALPDNTSVWTYVYKNGVQTYTLGATQNEAAASSVPQTCGSVSVELARGDTISIYAHQLSGGPEILETSTWNWLTIKKVD